jgi:hypothetical protein
MVWPAAREKLLRVFSSSRVQLLITMHPSECENDRLCQQYILLPLPSPPHKIIYCILPIFTGYFKFVHLHPFVIRRSV